MSDYSSILVTTDFSQKSHPGLEAAAELARRLDADVTVLYVVEDHLPAIMPFASEGDRKRILDGYCEDAAGKLKTLSAEYFDGYLVETAVVIGVASEEIVKFAERHPADLIVVTSRGYGPLRQLALGSTAERVLHHAPCPVLVVPSTEE